MKLILAFLVILSSSSHALESWSFIANRNSVECRGLTSGRFWLCAGDEYKGIIDREPVNYDLPFLPMFINSSDEIVLDIEIESWSNDLGDDLLIDELSFSYRDYFWLKYSDVSNALLRLETGAQTDVLPKDKDKLIEVGNQFFNKLWDFYALMKNLSYTHRIYQAGHKLFSQFELVEPFSTQPRKHTVMCRGKSDLSLDNQINLMAISAGAGREPTLDEALILLKEIIEDPKIPFSYTKDGCHARAHVVACKLYAKGIHTGKIWIAGDLENPNNREQPWSFHVAAVVYIDGEAYVIEPALDRHNLLTVEQWLSAHRISNPTHIAFPIPEEAVFFEDVVLAYSSHVPLWPYEYDGDLNLFSTLHEAYAINKEHTQLLNHKNLVE